MSLVTFQSTSPVRGMTSSFRDDIGGKYISIHIPRAGDDPAGVMSGRVANAFQSTSPVRGMTPDSGAAYYTT